MYPQHSFCSLFCCWCCTYILDNIIGCILYTGANISKCVVVSIFQWCIAAVSIANICLHSKFCEVFHFGNVQWMSSLQAKIRIHKCIKRYTGRKIISIFEQRRTKICNNGVDRLWHMQRISQHFLPYDRITCNKGHTGLCLCILFVRFDDSIQIGRKKNSMLYLQWNVFMWIAQLNCPTSLTRFLWLVLHFFDKCNLVQFPKLSILLSLFFFPAPCF